MSQNGRKKTVSLARKSVSTCKNKVIFSKIKFLVSHKQKKKAVNKRILFQVDKKLVSTSGDG